MPKHTPMLPSLPPRLGRTIATAAGAILFAVILVHGESWAIRQAPLLLTDRAGVASSTAGCLPDDSAGAGALPVAILH